jgi:hypothetical protein
MVRASLATYTYTSSIDGSSSSIRYPIRYPFANVIVFSVVLYASTYIRLVLTR